MRERYLTICSNETSKNGLVIIVALYGKLFNGNYIYYQSSDHDIRAVGSSEKQGGRHLKL